MDKDAKELIESVKNLLELNNSEEEYSYLMLFTLGSCVPELIKIIDDLALKVNVMTEALNRLNGSMVGFVEAYNKNYED